MVSSLREIPLHDRYATNRDDLVSTFYEPCLRTSTTYCRAVGYFRSSVLLLAAEAVADFAVTGNEIRIICSPELTQEDIAALEKGYERREKIGETLCRVIEQVVEDPLGRPVVEFLATLVAVGCLDLKIAFRPDAQGIFHDKVGIFRDSAGHAVSFTGSSNETLNAWDPKGNHESFDIFRSWTTEGGRVEQHVEYFERLWEGHEPGVETVEFPKVARERLVSVSNPEGVKAAYEVMKRSQIRTKRKKPQPHQLAAIDAWRRQYRRGILEHATGSGKTITAIAAMREWLGMGRPVLVLVPSELLLSQWYGEVRSELSDVEPRMLLAGAGHTRWRRAGMVEGFTASRGGPRVTISTLQTASTESFFGRVRDGDHLLLVADEVHRVGSPKLSEVLAVDAGARMGLSATPKRFGDPEGTNRLLDYFGGVADSFTLADAIAAGRLCRYTYHIHPIELTAEEMLEWRDMTREIGRETARSPRNEAGDLVFSERTKLLLIKRARTLKRASAKVPLAVGVLRNNFESGQRWLVYCDDRSQLTEVLESLRRAGLPCDEYYSDMEGSKETTLAHFSTMGGVLVAIKMLDEGVDIPSVDRALILASSRNPREFIQRRGRVLRTAPGKHYAEIHDALVMPPDREEADDTAILRGELARAAKFAESAANEAVKFRLRKLALNRGIDPDDLSLTGGFEDEEKS